jgi:large subunit ribosomal protein L29
MKNAEIRALTIEELKEKIASTEKTISSLRFAHQVTPIENPLRIRDAKRLLARLKTDLRSRVITQIEEKVKSGDLTNFNARETLATTSFDAPVTLDKLKKIIGRTGK